MIIYFLVARVRGRIATSKIKLPGEKDLFAFQQEYNMTKMDNFECMIQISVISGLQTSANLVFWNASLFVLAGMDYLALTSF